MTKNAKSSQGTTRRDVLRWGSLGAASLAIAGTGLGTTMRPALAQSGSLRLYANSSYRDVYNAAADRFMERHPDVRVRSQFAATDQLQTTTRVQLASGTAPDIVTVWPGNGNPLAVRQIAGTGFLRDLSDQPFIKNVPQTFQDVYRAEGKAYFFAPFISLIGVFVNKQVAEELGLTRPSTWDEFVAICQTVKDAGKIPLAIGNGTPWVTQLIAYALAATTVFSPEPEFAERMLAGQTTFAQSEGWREALTKYLQLQELGFFNSNPNGTSYEDALQLIGSGQAAMTVLTSPSTVALLNFAGHRDFVVWPLPGSNDADATQIPVSLGNGLGINANAENPDAAVALLNFMAEPEQMAEFSRVLEMPVLAEGIPVSSIYEEVVPSITDGRIALYMDNKWPNARVQQTLFSGVQELLNGSASVENILERMDSAFQS